MSFVAREGDRPRELKKHTPKGQPLCQVTQAQYGVILRKASESLKIRHRIRPHSPGAGFATENVARGRSAADVMREGRWSQEPTFRAYVDILQALATELEGS